MYSFADSHFDQFFKEIQLPLSEQLIAEARAQRIAKSLFAEYWPNHDFDPGCYVKVGSFGKNLATQPRTDLDMLFVLPREDYYRIEALSGNKQSALLQEVRRALLDTFPNTDISADGQVVVAPFQTYSVDIVPAFRFVSGPNTGYFLTANTGDGGSWRLSNPAAEYASIKNADAMSNGKATDLIKMLKAWKRECNVSIKSICLEVAAIVFVNQWQNRAQGTRYSYHDFLVRDFFAFLLNYVNGSAKPAGIDEWIPLGTSWATRCQSAYDRAVKACNFEHDDDALSASTEWQKIFGSQFHIDYSESSLARALAGLTF